MKLHFARIHGVTRGRGQSGIAIALIAVLLAVLVAGCIVVKTDPAAPTAQPAAPVAPQPAAAPGAPPASQVATQPAASPSAIASDDWIEQAMRATVKVWTINDKGKAIAECSGSIIDSSGLILTNWHCVGLTNATTNDMSGQNLRPGEMYNNKGLIVLGLTESPKEEPVPTYVAKVLQGSADLDIAVARIVDTIDGSGKAPKSLPVSPVRVGDSDQVKLGDTVRAFGYPGIGGKMITTTSGQISGFDKNPSNRLPDVRYDSFKTDVTIGHGSSGGLGTNGKGEQIGITTWGRPEQTRDGGVMFNFVMVNLAKPYITKAKSDVAEAVSPRLPAKSDRTQKPTPTPDTRQAGTFAKLVFGTSVKDAEVVGQAVAFPASAKTIVAVFESKNMAPSTPWGYTLKLDGELIVDKANGKTWEFESDDLAWVTFENGGKPMPEGKYEMALFIANKDVLRGGFTVGAQQQAPPAPQDQGVFVKGQILDADTKRGVNGALFVVLKPGVTVAQFVNAKDPTMVASMAPTQKDGTYRTPDPLARGQSYGILIVADGYQLAGDDKAVTVPASGPSEITLKTILLQQE